MSNLRVETGRILSISNNVPPKFQILLTITVSNGQNKQVFLYQGRQPLALVEGEEVSCIVNDTGSNLECLAYVNLSRNLHQETPPRSMYFQTQCILFFVYFIVLEFICLIFFDPRQGNTSQIVLFVGVLFLGLLPIAPFLRRWGNKVYETKLLMSRARVCMQELLAAQSWGRKVPEPPQKGGEVELIFPRNKKGLFFARIWRPAPGTMVDTPRICPFCNDAKEARNIGPQVIDETISVMKKGGIAEPPILQIHTCEHHFATLNPKALARENNKLVLSMLGINFGACFIFLAPTINLTRDFLFAYIVWFIVSLVVVNVLFFTFYFKRILKGNFEKQEKLHFGSWRLKQVAIYAKNDHWLAEFAQMHLELLAPVREIQRLQRS